MLKSMEGQSGLLYSIVGVQYSGVSVKRGSTVLIFK